MLNVFTLLVFLGVLLLCLAVNGLMGRAAREEKVALRLAALMETIDAAEPEAASSILLIEEKVSGPFARVQLAWQRLKKGLERLGWLKTLRIRVLLLLAVSFTLAAFVGSMSPAPFLVTVFGGLAIAIVVGAVLYWRAMGLWVEGLARSLPEAIDAIARICRAGVPAQTAFGLVAQNLTGPIAQEFLTLDRWLRLGVPLKEALTESARRVPLDEYRFFSVILIISQESGGRLADTLERLAATLRDRAELRLKVDAKTSEARASIKIVAALVPGVLLYQYTQSPQDFQFLVSDPVGLKVLFYAAASVGLGFFVSWLMVRRIS